MRGAVQLLAVAVAAFGAGCATTTVDTTFDEAQDFSVFRTWGWRPDGRNVSALPGQERELGALVTRLLDRELRGRGLERTDGDADLLVSFDLRVTRQWMTANETGAEQYLSSHHHGPSYQVQATRQRTDVFDLLQLEVVVTDGHRESVVWRGELKARRQDEIDRHLPAAVSALMESFPEGTDPSRKSAREGPAALH